MSFNISGTATCSGSPPNCAGQPTVVGSSSEVLAFPLPSVGLYVDYQIMPKLMAQARTDIFYLQAKTTPPAPCSSSMRGWNIA
jgi:hypothetical protein